MIRLIAAIDSKRGLAKNDQIPWVLPSDKARFRKLTLTCGANVLMGRRTFNVIGVDFLTSRHNYVAARQDLDLPPDCFLVKDLTGFLKDFQEDIWVIGGQQIYEQTIDLASELYLTIVEGDFSCDKFFPDYSRFKLHEAEGPYSENGLKFNYQLWTK